MIKKSGIIAHKITFWTLYLFKKNKKNKKINLKYIGELAKKKMQEIFLTLQVSDILSDINLKLKIK